MCADINQNPPSGSPEAAKPEGKAEKVRSPRYDWEHDIPAGDPTGRPRQPQFLKRAMAAVRAFIRSLFNSDRNPFDRDDDADPMAA